MIVYTAAQGRRVVTQKQIPGVSRYVCFSVERPPAPWEWVKLETPFSDPCRNAKVPKILPWRVFGDDGWTECLWIDSNHELLQLPQSESAVDMAIHKHSKRDCIFEEAKACVRKKKDKQAIIEKQIRDYAKMPRSFGLYECCIIYRKNTDRVRKICESWYNEIQKHSRRDQISLPYVLWQLNETIDSLGDNYETSGITRRHARK